MFNQIYFEHNLLQTPLSTFHLTKVTSIMIYIYRIRITSGDFNIQEMEILPDNDESLHYHQYPLSVTIIIYSP